MVRQSDSKRSGAAVAWGLAAAAVACVVAHHAATDNALDELKLTPGVGNDPTSSSLAVLSNSAIPLEAKRSVYEDLRNSPDALLQHKVELRELCAAGDLMTRLGALHLIEALGDRGEIFAEDVLSVLKEAVPQVTGRARNDDRLEWVMEKLPAVPKLQSVADRHHAVTWTEAMYVDEALEALSRFANGDEYLKRARAFSSAADYQDRVDRLRHARHAEATSL